MAREHMGGDLGMVAMDRPVGGADSEGAIWTDRPDRRPDRGRSLGPPHLDRYCPDFGWRGTAASDGAAWTDVAAP